MPATASGAVLKIAALEQQKNATDECFATIFLIKGKVAVVSGSPPINVKIPTPWRFPHCIARSATSSGMMDSSRRSSLVM